MTFKLVLFGSPRLVNESGTVVAFPMKGLLLAGNLLLSHEGYSATRHKMGHFLWEGAEDDHASTNMRQLLARIRNRQNELGLKLLWSDTRHIRLDPSVARIDVIEFQRLSTGEGRVDLGRICSLYDGDFLADADPEGEGARTWVEAHRNRLRSLFLAAVGRELDRPRPREQLPEVVGAAEKLLEIDPYQEVAHRALMRAASAQRQPKRVREIFDGCRAQLRSELGIAPEPATLDLMRELLPAVHPSSGVRATQPDGTEAASGKIRMGRTSGGIPRATILPPTQARGNDATLELATSLLEDVTIDLCSLQCLSLVAPHTAWRISQAGMPSQLIEQFGINYVAESRLSTQQGSTALCVNLMRAQSRELVWAERFELGEATVAVRFRQLSRRISRSLVDQIENIELRAYDVEPNPTAYAHYLFGRRDLAFMDLPRIRRARKAFRLALKACLYFVPALSGMARSYQREWLLLARGDRALLNDAEQFAVHAIALAPDDARGHREFGVCALFGGRFDEGVRALRQAEAASPNFADAVADLADSLVHASEPELGLATIDRAISLNPLCPDDYWWTAAGANYHLERYDSALACMSKMRDQAPALRLMAMTWAMKGDGNKARHYMRRTKEIHPDFRVESWISVVPFKQQWQKSHYEAGLRAAGFN